MKLLDSTATFFRPEVAVAKAAEMQAGDPDWTYRATNPTGDFGPFSKIQILDEDGFEVGFA